MSGKCYVIDGQVEKVRAEMENYTRDDIFVYQWQNQNYENIQTLYKVLLEQEDYSKLKDFNECQFLIEHAVGSIYNRSYYPLNMQIEHTSYCNARCIMCSHYYMGNNGCQHMQKETFEKIKKWLPYVRLVGLHGYGEPFLAKDIQSYLKEYKKYGVRFYVNTNLSVLLEGIEAYYPDFSFINISCDGTTKEVFESIRRNLKFDDFIENVKRLRAQAKDVHLIFAVVLMRQNLHQCKKFVEMAAELGIDEVSFSKVGINYIIGNYEDSVENYPQMLYKNLKEAIEEGERSGVKVTVPLDKRLLEKEIDAVSFQKEQATIDALPFWNYTCESIQKKLEKKKFHDIPLQYEIEEKCFDDTGVPVQGVCDWLLENIYISAEGKVAFCCSNARYYVGDLRVQSLDAIWNGEYYRRMIGVFQKGCLPDYCRHCNHLAKQMLRYVKCDTEELLRLSTHG